MAVDALETVAETLRAVASQLRRVAVEVPGVPDCHAPEAFAQNLAAAGNQTCFQGSLCTSCGSPSLFCGGPQGCRRA